MAYISVHQNPLGEQLLCEGIHETSLIYCDTGNMWGPGAFQSLLTEVNIYCNNEENLVRSGYSTRFESSEFLFPGRIWYLFKYVQCSP